jgi:hypothetical protein
MQQRKVVPVNQIELRTMLCEMIAAVQNGESSAENLNAVSSAANSVIKSVALQIKYDQIRGVKPFSTFIKSEVQ